MKKNLKKLVVALLAIHLGLMMNMLVANAAGDAPAPGKPGDIRSTIETLQVIGEGTNLPSFNEDGKHADAPADYQQPGVATIASPVLFLIDLMRFVISGIAIFVLIVSAGKLIINSDEEEEVGKAKNALIWGAAGLILIQFANVLVKKMFFGDQGEAFGDAGTSQLFAEESVSQIRGIVGFIQVFIGAVAVLVIIVRGFMLVTNAGDEEGQTKAKTHLLWGVAGLIVVGLSEVVIRGFIFPEAGNALPSVDVGKKIVISLTNYISGFVAIFAFANLFIAGYRYVVSGGNEEVNEKVKKQILGSVIAILIALGAFGAVNTFITLEARPDENSQAQVEINPEQ